MLSLLVALWVRDTVSSAVFVSLSAVTVTVLAVLQFDVVKVRLAGVADTSVPEVPSTAIVTLDVGWVFSTTV